MSQIPTSSSPSSKLSYTTRALEFLANQAVDESLLSVELWAAEFCDHSIALLTEGGSVGSCSEPSLHHGASAATSSMGLSASHTFNLALLLVREGRFDTAHDVAPGQFW